MASKNSSANLPVTVSEVLSAERFGRYVEWADGDEERALELYLLNLRVSSAFATVLHFLEIALRNRIHTVLSDLYGADWFDHKHLTLSDRQINQIHKARTELLKKEKQETPGRIVAETTFSFWTAFLSNDFEELWRQGLNGIAQDGDGRRLNRKKLSTPLGKLRTLRNRIAHHEPIIYWSLDKHYDLAIQLIRWLAPPAADLADQENHFWQHWPEAGPQLRAVQSANIV